ncbi:MAG: amino acid ABC transporter substrate-binding protein [Alphaproteobacteria bacterium]|nr:amino acid ABC transporter substrate-binding protein [Alphaproteobacteria bacterium]
MKKIVLSLMLSVSIIACGEKTETPKENTKPVVKIGATLPLTGDMAYAGQNMKAAMELSLKDLDKANLKYDYQLVFEDDAFELKKAQQNLIRMNDIEKINAVMSFWGAIGTLASNYAEQKQIIHMGCALSEVVGKGKYNFNHATTPKEHAATLIKYYKDHGYKKVGLLYNGTSECIEFGEILKNMLLANGFEVPFDIQVLPSSRDFKAEIIKMKAAQPDALFVELPSPLIEIFGKQVKELNFDVALTNINTFPSAPELFEGHIYLTEKEGDKSFYDYFEKNTGLYPMPCTVNIYDGLRMIVEGFEKAKADDNNIPQNDEVVEIMLNNHNFKGAVSILGIDEEGNINSASVIKRIINGKPITVEK